MQQVQAAPQKIHPLMTQLPRIYSAKLYTRSPQPLRAPLSVTTQRLPSGQRGIQSPLRVQTQQSDAPRSCRVVVESDVPLAEPQTVTTN